MVEALRQADLGNVDYFKVAAHKYVVEARNSDNQTVLTRTAIKGHLECGKVILGRWPDLLYEPDRYGDTVLVDAIWYDKIEFAKFLAVGAQQRLFRTARVDFASPLHLAIKRANLESVKILTEADPDFDSIPANAHGETPQMLAVVLASAAHTTEIQVQIKDWIIKKLDEKNAPRDSNSEPIDRATKGDADFFKRVQYNAGTESRDEIGNTVLHVAVLNGHFECSYKRHTPLHHAVFRGVPQIVKLLIVGADKKLFKMQNISGSTPMHMAVWKKRLEIVKILIKADLDYNQLPANNSNETPLMMAQRLAYGKMNDDVSVKIEELLAGKQTGTENIEDDTTSDVNKLSPTARERELSIPLKYLDLYRRLVKQFGGIAPLRMDKLDVGPIDKALANFLVFAAEMQVETPDSISEEKLMKWEDAYSSSARWGLQIDWFNDRIQWFRDWLDRRKKSMYPVEDEVERKERQLSILQAEFNISKAKLENTRSAYSKFDFKIFKD